MPTYEYACRACSERLEVVQSFRDEPLTECPSCGGQLRKVFQPVGISFKGSGFYKNDSREAAKAGKSQPSSSSDAAPQSGDGASSGGPSSDSQPASTAGSKAGESSGSSGTSSASSPDKSSSPAASS